MATGKITVAIFVLVT